MLQVAKLHTLYMQQLPLYCSHWFGAHAVGSHFSKVSGTLRLVWDLILWYVYVQIVERDKPVTRFLVIGYTSNVLRKFVDTASKRKTADPLAATATTSPSGRIWSGGKCSIFRNLEPCNTWCVYVFTMIQGLAQYGWGLDIHYVCVDSSWTVLEQHRSPFHSYLCW